MKKLRIALVALFALTMSLFLFACNKGNNNSGNPNTPGGEKVLDSIRASSNTIQVTDVDTLDKVKEEFGKLTFTGVYTDENGDNSKEEALTPKDGEVNYDGVTVGTIGSYTVVYTPSEKNEYKTKIEITVTIDHNYQAVEGQEGVFSCTKDGATKTEKTVDEYVKFQAWCAAGTPFFKDENKNTVVTAFGGDALTATVGRIDKGMKITLTGKAKTINEAAGGNENAWNYPILGVANREEDGGFVCRNDYWGIWDVAGLPAWARGNAAIASGTATADSEEMTPYYFGTTSVSADYADWTNVELSWEYSMDCVLTVTWLHTDTGKTFGFTMKMPERQYYETVLHGEFVEMQFTKFSVVQSLKLQSIEDPKIEKDVSFLENTYLDNSIFTVEASFAGGLKQKADPAILTVYGNKTANAEENAEGWIDLTNTKLSKEFVSFKISATIGSDTFTKLLAADQAAKLKIVPNAVDHAVSNDVKKDGTTFGATDLTGIEFLQTEDAKVGLNITGLAMSLNAAQKAALGTQKSHYIAFTVYANGATKFNTQGLTAEGTEAYLASEDGSKLDVVLAVDDSVVANGVTLKVQDTEIKVTFKNEIDEAGLFGTTVFSSYEATEIKLDEAKDITITYDLGKDYTAAEVASTFNITVNGVTKAMRANKDELSFTNVNVTGIDRFKLGAVTYANKKLTVTYNVPAFNPANPVNYVINLVEKNTGATVASDKIDYTFGFATEQALANGYYTVVKEGTLYLVKAYSEANLTATTVAGSTLLFSANKGGKTAEDFRTYKVLQAHDLSFAIAADGSASLTASGLMLGLATVKTTYFGTLGNAEDTDYGAIVVVAVDLTKLGIAAGEEFAYAVDAGESNYYYKTVSATGEVGANVTYTLPSTDPIEITKADPNNCAMAIALGYAFDGAGATTDLEKAVFFAGISFRYNEHKWVKPGTETAAEGLEDAVCSQCGALRFTAEDATGSFTFVALDPQDDVVNNDTNKDDWWAGPTADIPVGGNFVIRYTYDNTDSGYGGDAAVEMYAVDGETKNYFASRLFGGDFNPGSGTDSTSALHAKDKELTVVYKQNGKTVESLNVTDWAGKFDLLIYRYGTTLVLDTKDTVGENTYEQIITITKFTTEDLYIHLNGNTAWVENIKVNVGEVVAATVKDNKTVVYQPSLGDAQPEEGKDYPFSTWYDLPNLTEGKTITATGHQKGNVSSNWFTLLWEMKDGYTGRLDNFGWTFGDTPLFTETAKTNAVKPEITDDDDQATKFWAKYKEIAQDCDWSIAFTLEGQVVNVVIVLTKGDDTYTQNYTLTATREIPAEGLGIHLCGEDVTITFNGYSVK